MKPVFCCVTCTRVEIHTYAALYVHYMRGGWQGACAARCERNEPNDPVDCSRARARRRRSRSRSGSPSCQAGRKAIEAEPQVAGASARGALQLALIPLPSSISPSHATRHSTASIHPSINNAGG